MVNEKKSVNLRARGKNNERTCGECERERENVRERERKRESVKESERVRERENIRERV